jgi:hypothetical protein
VTVGGRTAEPQMVDADHRQCQPNSVSQTSHPLQMPAYLTRKPGAPGQAGGAMSEPRGARRRLWYRPALPAVSMGSTPPSRVRSAPRPLPVPAHLPGPVLGTVCGPVSGPASGLVPVGFPQLWKILWKIRAFQDWQR